MTQKELTQVYADILNTEVWRNDKKMIDFCVKKSAYIVELENGEIITIDKPSIEKSFCFGYSDSRYDTEDYDRANDAAHHASTNEGYFMRENLKDITQMIKTLSESQSWQECYLCVPYYGQPQDSKLKALRWCRTGETPNTNSRKLEGTDRERVIEGYNIVKYGFEKRLQAYLKRYGMSKVHTWSYWRDE